MAQLHSRFARAAVAAAAVMFSASVARAQGAAYNVMIDSVAVGTATAVANLPVPHVTTPTHHDSTPPGHQANAGTQTSVVMTTSDPALLTVLRGWMGANNSGKKDTVQPKLVEIDQVAGDNGGPFRYVLHDAWPSRIDPSGTSSVVTIVYQRAEVLR